MKSIKQVLQGKNRPLISVSPDTDVYTALETMAKHDIGALLVLDGERLAGIFSERDYARKIALSGQHSKTTQVSSVMTEKVFYVTPEQTVAHSLPTILWMSSAFFTSSRNVA